MIIKMSDGAFYEMGQKEYTTFIAELMVHFNTENKLTVNFQADTRVEAAKMLLTAVANTREMSPQTKEDYLRVAFELIERYNDDLKQSGRDKEMVDYSGDTVVDKSGWTTPRRGRPRKVTDGETEN